MGLSRNLIIYWQCPIQGCEEVMVEMCGTLKLCYRILDGHSIPVEAPNDTRCPRRFPLDINDDAAREYPLGCDPCSQHTDDEVAEFQRVQQLENDAAWQRTVDGVVDWQLEGGQLQPRNGHSPPSNFTDELSGKSGPSVTVYARAHDARKLLIPAMGDLSHH